MIKRVGGSLLLVVAEMAWVTTALDAFANGTAGHHRPAVSLPFLALAVPAVLAVMVAHLVKVPNARLASGLAVTVVALLLAAISAEIVSSLTPGVAMWSAPTSLVAARAVRWAAVGSVIAWARGTWLGVAAPSPRQATSSCALGAAVMVAVVAERATGHPAALGRATAGVAWMLVVLFVSGVGAIAWTHHQSIERAAMRRAGNGPGAGWLGVMAIPAAALVGAAFLAALLGDAVGPAAVRALGQLGSFIAHHVSSPFHHLSLPTSGAGPIGGEPHPPPPHHAGKVPPVSTQFHGSVGDVVLGLVILAALVAAGYYALRVTRVLSARRQSVAVDEQRSSFFSWSRLLARLRAVVFRRRQHVAPAPVPITVEVPAPDAQLDPVRAAYRRFLLASRAAALGRSPTETPRELARRLPLDRGALGELTSAYERVRYGMQDPRDAQAVAVAATGVLTAELDAGTSTSREEASAP